MHGHDTCSFREILVGQPVCPHRMVGDLVACFSLLSSVWGLVPGKNVVSLIESSTRAVDTVNPCKGGEEFSSCSVLYVPLEQVLSILGSLVLRGRLTALGDIFYWCCWEG